MTLSERMYEASDGVSRYWAVEVKQLEQENERLKKIASPFMDWYQLDLSRIHDHFPSEPE